MFECFDYFTLAERAAGRRPCILLGFRLLSWLRQSDRLPCYPYLAAPESGLGQLAPAMEFFVFGSAHGVSFARTLPHTDWVAPPRTTLPQRLVLLLKSDLLAFYPNARIPKTSLLLPPCGLPGPFGSAGPDSISASEFTLSLPSSPLTPVGVIKSWPRPLFFDKPVW